MKAPKKIYLQHGMSEDELNDYEFKDIYDLGITWSAENQSKNDWEYIHISKYKELIENKRNLLIELAMWWDSNELGTRIIYENEVDSFLLKINKS